jgi:hypothetical protein
VDNSILFVILVAPSQACIHSFTKREASGIGRVGMVYDEMLIAVASARKSLTTVPTLMLCPPPIVRSRMNIDEMTVEFTGRHEAHVALIALMLRPHWVILGIVDTNFVVSAFAGRRKSLVTRFTFEFRPIDVVPR